MTSTEVFFQSKNPIVPILMNYIIFGRVIAKTPSR